MRIYKPAIVLCFAAGLLALAGPTPNAGTTPSDLAQDAIDVNDISFLWPAPKTKADVDALISLADTLDDGKSPMVPQDAFGALLGSAVQVQVNDSAKRPKQINFVPFADQFHQQKTWKIAAVRIDPSAPGTAPEVTKTIGVIPQIRLIVQPVTIDNGGIVTIHDTTAHLVFSYVANQTPPFQPDKQKFAEIVNDARALKQFLKTKNVLTAGPLGVHPGLRAPIPGFPDKVKALLQKHLSESRLTALAFMGIQRPEPWIFFSMDRTTGKWAVSKNPVAGDAQMLIMSSGDPVCPPPVPLNFDGKRGVSTSLVFDRLIAQKLEQAAFPDVPSLKLKDVPDFIANPLRAHFFNTDCVSCHNESTRRTALGLDAFKSTFRFSLPAGISGLDPTVASRGIWNVRNFGWGDTTGIPTVTQRTANEAANAADFINKNYGRTKMATSSVSHPLTLVMTIKGDKELQELKAMLQGDPKNEIAAALDKIGTVHFARFVFLDDRHLAVITTFDNDFDAYIDTFVDALGPIFDNLLARMDGAPPLPVSKNRKDFLDYVKRNDHPAAAFYSAYPDLNVGDILTLQMKQQGKK